MTNEIYIGAPEIRRRYKITPPTLRRWLKVGLFPKPDIRIANRDKWKASTIEDFESRADNVAEYALRAVGMGDRPDLGWGRFKLAAPGESFKDLYSDAPAGGRAEAAETS
jgi:hypothetical protein